MDAESRKSHKSKKFCSVVGCQGMQVSMFVFPKNEARRRRWIEVCRLTREPSKYSYICIRHFCRSDYNTTATGMNILKKTAVPTLHLPSAESLIKKKDFQSCIVRNCTYGLHDSVTLHRFPRSSVRQEGWKTAVQAEYVSQNTRICSRHFKPSDFTEFSNGKKVLSTSAFPSLHLPGMDNDAGCCDCVTTKNWKVFCKQCQTADRLREGEPGTGSDNSGRRSESSVEIEEARDPEESPVSEALLEIPDSVVCELSSSETADVNNVLSPPTTSASDHITSSTRQLNVLLPPKSCMQIPAKAIVYLIPARKHRLSV